MISFAEALQIVINNNVVTHHETVPLSEAVNRVLYHDVYSDMDMPPFDKSAVDGFACRRQDLHNKLIVQETIAAGKAPQKALGENQCSKIMTGAMLPQGADCVIMVEDTQVICDKMVKFLKENTANNICYKAEDVKCGGVIGD